MTVLDTVTAAFRQKPGPIQTMKAKLIPFSWALPIRPIFSTGHRKIASQFQFKNLTQSYLI